MTLKLLIAVEGDLRRALAEQFVPMTDFILTEAESATSALASIEAAAPDLLLTCSAFAAPDENTLLRRARQAGYSGPAILIAQGESDSELALEFDAALSRPFRFARLLSLIRALGAEAERELSEPWGADPPLTEKETAILARLAEAGGEVVARQTLLREIWGYSPNVATHTLETHIHRLRRKLEGEPRRRFTLQTAPGGYRLATAAGPAVQAARK
jgi:DNA-binding response OmpR family regulator